LWKLLGNLQEEFAGVVVRVESLREPHKGMLLQSVLDAVFKGE